MQTGRKILNLRCDRKISQQELARLSGITPSALSKIEAGINAPRAKVLWMIAKNLGVTVEYLLDEEVPYPYPGYNYRQAFLANEENPDSMVRLEVTREEKSFLEALRQTNQVSRDIAFAIPEASVETLRLVHFLIHHSRIQNPSQTFLKDFESLLSAGNVGSTASGGDSPAHARRALEPAGRKGGRGRASRAEPRGRKKARGRTGR